MKTETRFDWREAIKSGLVGGVVALLLALVGMVELFSRRDIIEGVISMGHTLLLFALATGGVLTIYRATRDEAARPTPLILLASGALAGLVTGGCVGLMVFVGGEVNLRAVFINASPELYEVLTFGQSRTTGILLLLAAGALIGAAVALLYLLPERVRRAVPLGLAAVVLMGLVQELLQVMLGDWGDTGDLFTWMLARKGLSVSGALVTFLVVAAGDVLSGLMADGWGTALVWFGGLISLRAVLIRTTSGLADLFTARQDQAVGVLALLVLGVVVGAVITLVHLLPKRVRHPLWLGLVGAVLFGLLRAPILNTFDRWGTTGDLFTQILAPEALSILGALVVFLVIAGVNFLWQARRQTFRAGVERTFRGRSDAAIETYRQIRDRRNQVLALLGLLVLPHIVGSYPSEVLDMVGVFALMGLGLNIVVGFAGLLDLGYVAFFAIGAYTMGVLTSPEIAWHGFHMNFWQALPFSVLMATLAGIILGIPVLNMRGDYLAIVTLGFGEIIRLVALSDWLKPRIGGSNGITQIPKALIGSIELPFSFRGDRFLIVAGCLLLGFVLLRSRHVIERFLETLVVEIASRAASALVRVLSWALMVFGGAGLAAYLLNAVLAGLLKILEAVGLGSGKIIIGAIRLSTPETLYYLILAGCLLVAFVSWRLKNSRLGRTWVALREDEDVAEAMGINLVQTKLLAFASGAAFAGLAGAIFASKLTSIYPHSFDLLKSINALCIIIVGGMGSVPGVIVGSFALVGLPELLREFAEYRYLVYGLTLVIMMLARPEGLLPEERRRRELHEEEEALAEEEFEALAAGATSTA